MTARDLRAEARAGATPALQDDVAERFEAQRGLLFGIAYRMLGSVMDAEDAVQDAYLRFRAVEQRGEDVRSDRALLTTIVTRLCLDRLKAAQTVRERYVGPWLPEPLVTAGFGPVTDASPEAQVEQRETLTMAFLVLLQSLSPLERAVFLLHEVFGFSFAEIGAIVARSEPACRQLFHRASRHVEQRRPRYSATPQQVEQLTFAFVAASARGDMDSLVRLLADDVVLWADGGGKVAAALKPVYGPSKVARGLVGFIQKAPHGLSVELAEVNGCPAVVLFDGAEPFGVAIVEGDGARVHAIYSINNPDKLAALRR
jgi:RNA polymerase sigma-70 factor (ECF subfamily)